MKKKILALALILIIATGGVFAAAKGTAVIATLSGVVGSVFDHGFREGETKYKESISLTDVFNLDKIELVYGYRAKDATGFKAEMMITPFTAGDENDIQIASVLINDEPVNKVGNKYLVLTYGGDDIGDLIETEVPIVIQPNTDDLADASPGTYVSTVTISIVADAV